MPNTLFRYRCPEALFQPSYLGSEDEGIHEMVWNTIAKYVINISAINNGLTIGECRCDIEIRRDLWSNVVVAGGSAMFRGLAARLNQELVALAPSTMVLSQLLALLFCFSLFLLEN